MAGPLARCGCSEGVCNCTIQAGPGTTITGSGTASSPYIVSADGAVDCTDVRPCITSGDGASYNQATGVISARPSTDPGNAIAFGGDGGLYALGSDCATVRACLTEGDGVDYNPVTGEIAAKVSTDVGNGIIIGSDGGLYATVSCPTVRACLSEGDGVDYDPGTGVIASKLSTDPGNTAVFGGDGGVYVPAATTSCATVRACL